MGWTDACVQLAQETCPEVCDTRLGITASRGATTELYQAEWNGTGWTTAARTDIGEPLSWVAPAPGETEIRIANTAPGQLVIGSTVLDVPEGRSYETISTVGFDRDGRDTIAASYSIAEPAVRNFVEIWKLGDEESVSVLEMSAPASAGLVWGDENRDAFPDAIVKNGASYSFLDNVERDDATHSRTLSNQTLSNTSGGATPGSPGVRNLDWLDFNGDGKLDLAVFGASLRIHTKADDLNDVAQVELDCDPPSTARTCIDRSGAEPRGRRHLSGARCPRSEIRRCSPRRFPIASSIASAKPADAIAVERIAFPGDSCTCVANCNMNQCPGPTCTCTYDCQACPPIVALVARDLDGDHKLDIIAIDAKLGLYTGARRQRTLRSSAPVTLVTPAPAELHQRERLGRRYAAR